MHNPNVTPISPISGIKQGTGNVSPQTSINSSGKGSATQESKGANTKDTNSNESKEKEKQVRYPNKLTPKQPANNGSHDSSLDGSSKNINTNKGVASEPSKARGTVTENKDNANKIILFTIMTVKIIKKRINILLMQDSLLPLQLKMVRPFI